MHSGKGVGDSEHQPEEEGSDDVPDDFRPQNGGFVGSVPETDPHRGQVARKDERPQQDGAGQIRPHGGYPIDKRRERAVVAVYIGQREVVAYQRPLHGHRGQHGPAHDQPYIDLAGPQQRWPLAGEPDNQG